MLNTVEHQSYDYNSFTTTMENWMAKKREQLLRMKEQNEKDKVEKTRVEKTRVQKVQKTKVKKAGEVSTEDNLEQVENTPVHDVENQHLVSSVGVFMYGGETQEEEEDEFDESVDKDEKDDRDDNDNAEKETKKKTSKEYRQAKPPLTT